MTALISHVVTHLLLPPAVLQGLWVRVRTPRLPEASGPCRGIVEGESPPLNLVVLGESPVAGIGAPTHELALTGQTALALARRSNRKVNWRALGLSGATAERARLDLVPEIADEFADILIVVLGVNDVIQWRGVSRWTRDIEQLVDVVRRQVSTRLVVLTGVPPFQCFPAFPQPLRSILGMRSRLLDRAYCDLAKRLPNVIHVSSQFELGREFFCEDGFHPSQSGYAAWGDQLAEVIVHGPSFSLCA